MSESPSDHHRLRRLPTSPPQERPNFFRRQEARNSEEAHAQALDQSKRHHDRIYDVALITLETYNYEQLKAENEATEARVLASERAAAEAEKARQLAQRNAAADAKKTKEMREQASADAIRAKELEEQVSAAAASRAAQAATSALQRQASVDSSSAAINGQAPIPPPSPTPTVQPTPTPPIAHLPTVPANVRPQLPTQPPPLSQSSSINQSTPVPPVTTQPFHPTSLASPQSQQLKAANPSLHPDEERLKLIHGNLKKMRAYMKSLCDQDPALKKKTGEMRRLVRMSVGQLTGGETDQNANKRQLTRVTDTLKEALHNTVYPTPLMNIEDFVVGQREPVQGAMNNGQLPVLYMFLLNHFSKAVMAQFALEGTKPLCALSVGIFTVRIFATPEYLWRGKSLIDVLIAKFRALCPVLFGVRDNDTTNEGRAKVGWKRTPSGEWVAHELHAQRMMGFAAGYAAICLRDFSRSAKLSHPYGVAPYWKAFASIIATPPNELSKTQCYVLKALIDHYEKKFVGFYGSAALAALQVATIQVPSRIQTQNDATIALGALATKMHLDLGINLKHDAFRA